MGIEYAISDIVEIVKGKPEPGAQEMDIVKEILLDSRNLSQADKTLFVALTTERNDGHKYIPELIEKGVRNFLVSKLPEQGIRNPESLGQKREARSEKREANFIVVPDTLTALQKFAAYHRGRFNIPVVGITGSNGKTIVKEWLFQLLSPEKKIIRSPKSYNSQIGVPLSVLEMASDHDFAIFEAGISQLGEMNRLESIIRPTIGIFTNIGSAHDENFNNAFQKSSEKMELFKNVDLLIYCKDYLSIANAIERTEFPANVRIVKWSRKEHSELFISEVSKGDDQTVIHLVYHDKSIQITIPFIDEASVENAVHCWLLMLELGYDQETISKRMKSLTPIEMRLELKEGINHCSIINDSYSLDLNSLSIAIDFLNQQKQHRQKTVILSDILQSGRKETDLYYEVAQLLQNKGVNKLIGIGTGISGQKDQFSMDKHFFESTSAFIEKYPFSSFHEETILTKGARIFEFERISALLQQKVHETVLEINLDALVHNLNYYRSLLNPATKIMVMVKAFSYGSGSFEIANLLQFHHVDYLAVAYADEGVELRKAGITLPIMVMNPEEQSFELLLKHNLEPEIYNFRTLKNLEKAIQPDTWNKEKLLKIHIKIDSGMHRLGFDEQDVDQLLAQIRSNTKIKVESLFSHLAASEAPLHDDFTLTQIEHFKRVSKKIIEYLGYPVSRHILNSAGISRFPQEQMEMVRLGIGLYGVGYNPEEQLALKNVSTLKSAISQLKRISAGDTIGYNRAGKITRDSTIAIIPIGYADGLNRRLGNGTGKIFVEGCPAPVIGNICMDLTMIDVTDIIENKGISVREGDEVIIFGDEYPISNLAEDLGTIPYEILTVISRRVKRVYYHE